MTKEITAFSIQDFLPIKDIKENVVILKDNSLRAILMTSSVNFDLKSTQEQEATIYKYQGVLNSFDFTVQIMIASRRFNIEPYIEQLTIMQAKQDNELLRLQTSEYIDFIRGLTELANIMTESFYVVIPYADAPIQKMGLFSGLFGQGKTKASRAEIQDQDFAKKKIQLWQRVEFVASTLQGVGIQSAPLNNNELLELFYKLYNPGLKGDLETTKTKETKQQ